ncbi:MAG: tRNA (adenosine(37)-N6)-dimethylallyltransferase MiaA [Phycisphaerae bacterium]|nr:tRNA (adenosine(37)-N6)-dimethylallyltransferase MiaA [Phycisphaerae bacterium]
MNASAARFPLIVGPTASGKSGVALALARALSVRRGGDGGRGSGVGGGAGVGAQVGGAEIIAADAFQIYRGMDIGTAKPSATERTEVPHHLVDVAEPDGAAFTVDDWLRAAEASIASIRARGGLPVVVGGTHLYAKALLDGLFEGPPPDPALRAQLAAMDPAARRAELERIDPAAAARIHPNDSRRTVRALEVFRQTGASLSFHQQQWDRGRARRDVLLVTLEWPVEALNRRINARVRAMMDQGLLEEARGLWRAGRLGPQAREALGYKQLMEHFEGRAALDDAVERIKIETRRFAKNQRTWIRRLRASVSGLALSGEMDPLEAAAAIVRAISDPVLSQGHNSPDCGI